MKKSDKLKQARAAAAEKAQAILDSATDVKPLTAEQKTEVSNLTTEVANYKTQIDQQIEIENALLDRPAASGPRALPQLDENGNTPGARVWTPAFSLKNFTAKTGEHGGRKAEENAYRSGMWLSAVINGSKKAMAWCQEHGVFGFGTDMVAAEVQAAGQRAGVYNTVHEEGTNSTGGFLVPDEYERTVISLRDSYGVARRFCNISNMSSDYKIRPKRLTGLTATPRGESAAVTETNKTWGQVALTAKSWDLLTKYSRELNEDAVISMADDLAGEAALAFAYAEDNALFNGDASGTYNGISGLYTIWFNQWGASESWLGGVTTATHDLPTEVDATDLAKVVGQTALYARQSPRAAWFCSPEFKAVIFDRLTGAAGGNNQGDLAAGRPARYAGYPIIECLTAPATAYATAQDEKPMVWFGDMSMVVEFGNRRGMTLQPLNELYAANGQIGLIASERFDINVHNYGTTAVKSPMVAYMGETS